MCCLGGVVGCTYWYGCDVLSRGSCGVYLMVWVWCVVRGLWGVLAGMGVMCCKGVMGVLTGMGVVCSEGSCGVYLLVWVWCVLRGVAGCTYWYGCDVFWGELRGVLTGMGALCCSCAIMLLQQGACVTDEIVLYDPKLEVDKPVETKPAVPKKEKPVLKWRPLQNLQLKKEPKEKRREAHSIFQVGTWLFSFDAHIVIGGVMHNLFYISGWFLFLECCGDLCFSVLFVLCVLCKFVLCLWVL